MDLQTAISRPDINVFDIIPDKKSQFGFSVYTYWRPNETFDEWYERDNKNFQKAIQLKSKKP